MLAERNNVIPQSEIRKMFNLALGRKDVYNLTVGQPDFDTPQRIKDAAKKAIDEGYTGYTHNAGMIEVREAMGEKLKKDNNIDADPVTDIICTAGGMGALVLANLVLINPGDEVLYPDPGFVSHFAHIRLAGGIPVPVQLKKKHGFTMRAEDIERQITEKTRVIVINSPQNPTGGVISNKELRRIADLAIEHNLVVISDEAYEKYRYDNKKPLFIGAIPEMRERTVSLFSFSKSYAMTGWRIGFAVGPTEIIQAMTKLQEHILAMPTSISQKAAEAALKGSQDCVKEMLSTFTRRREIMTKGLQQIEGIDLDPPGGAFYVFPDITAFPLKSFDLAIRILNETNVVTVHGSAFGVYGEGFLRLCYAVSTDVIEESLQRLDTFLPKLIK